MSDFKALALDRAGKRQTWKSCCTKS